MLRISVKNAIKYSLVSLLLAACFFALTACSSISYYGQSIIGHNKLMLARKPIDKLLESSAPELKSQLITAQKIRKFAVDELSLPDNSSYSTYVDLNRDYPVWTVVAATEFSVNPKLWCYPIIGCASYRGYFSKRAALDYAKQLQSEGFETSVGGAIAYSTLGWFSDPLLPSMMRYGEAGLAENIFHELAHQVVYVNNNTAFNEAFASVVGEQGTLRWLQRYRPELIESYLQKLRVNAEFSNLLNRTKTKLADLYLQDISVQLKRLGKTQLIQLLQSEYQTLKKQQWQDLSDYDSWFETPINNARLAAVSTYRDHMPAIQLLLTQCSGDFDKFFTVVNKLVKQYPAESLLQSLPEDCEAVL